jgi:transcriptional regulator with XRE-family HTH domain
VLFVARLRYGVRMTMIDNPSWTLTDRLKRARLVAGLEQGQIADMLGVARTTVSSWERGISEPSATNFVRWSELTGQSLEWLAEGVHAKAPAEAGADVRHEGFEPPTFWSVASGLLALIWSARAEAAQR